MARPIRFPRQHTLSFSEEHSDRLQAEAEENQMSLSEVARTYMEIAIAVIDGDKAAVATLDPDAGS